MRDLFEPPQGFQPTSHRLILASSSPRRRELMTRYGYQFEVIPPDPRAECGICSRETPPELVARLAYQKGSDVISQIHCDDRIVVSCDTVAECHGIVLGKPDHREHAREMLERLRGREHRVYSGLCLWSRKTGHRAVRVDVSVLKMNPISDQELDGYLDSEQWVGKAGSLGFQDGPPWIALITGSATNVVGLPMELLDRMLADF
ncbi:MAG: nucleoside triphosphate pyrophosphatase [Planctomycetota bacterium]